MITLKKLREIAKKVKKRNKLIKIADSSEAGWNTVRQYESNPVAIDTDDENWINKDENRALRKRKFKNTKKDSEKPNNTPGPQFSNIAANMQQQPFREPPEWYTGTPIYSGMPSTSSNNARRFQRGGCYGCGSMQH